MGYAIAFFVLIAGIAGTVAVTIYNRLMALDSRCDKAGSDVDVQLKHRHSLIPNLVETVKGFIAHERQTLEAVVRARQVAIMAPTPELRMAAEATLGTQLTHLIATAEAHPALQASEHFRALRSELADAENKISAARRFFNLAVDEYNTTLKQFPSNFVAGFARLTRRAFFDLGLERGFVEEGPAVKF